MDKDIIYFDNASTTSVFKEVSDIICTYNEKLFFNPSGTYSQSKKIKQEIENSRIIISKLINCNPNEIFFTSSGTESNNWAIKGIAYRNINVGNHIIISSIEHHSVENTCKYLEKNGFNITKLKVDKNGFIDINQLEKTITDKTILVSIIYANNEIGVIQNISKIGKICKKHNIIFHTDAVQAFGHVKIDVMKDNIDMLSISGHKFGAPKGIGVLYINKKIKIDNLIEGGGQEKNKRSGTENVSGIIALCKAAEITCTDFDKKNNYLLELRNYCINKITNEIPYCKLNGPIENRLTNNVNFSFNFIEGESLVLRLNKYNICCSTGSACSSNSLDPSHVLLAIGLPHELAHGSLRLTFSTKNTKPQIDYFIIKLKEIVENLRNLSPLYEDFLKLNQNNKIKPLNQP